MSQEKRKQRFYGHLDEFWNEKNANRYLKIEISSSRKKSENELEQKISKTMSFDLKQKTIFPKFCNGEGFSNPVKDLNLGFENLIRFRENA